MARVSETSGSTEAVIPLNELHGCPVWTESGERLGTVRNVDTDADGRIVSLDVRDRWMFGSHHIVPAQGMRMQDGGIVVPTASAVDVNAVDSRRDVLRDTDGDVGVERSRAVAPVFLAGREGARRSFGGLDLVGSFFGALVTIASIVLIGGLLAAIFDTQVAAFDTSLDSFDAVTASALLVGAATLFLSCFLGGWAAGRSARFDGPGNGLMSVVMVLVLGVVFAALGANVADKWDIFAGADFPTFVSDDYALWGTIALGVALVLMLLGGALGGALGESWHRRADRAMLDVVSPSGATTTDRVGSPVASQDPLVVDPIDRDRLS